MKKHNAELREVRNTIESLWIAIVLAFVLRAFLLESFVIPTGSMAPRLMGRHVQVVCPDCGYSFPRGIGRTDTGVSHNDPQTWCPNCGEDVSLDSSLPGLSGDRVMVLKLPESIRPLKRWDVVVFRDSETNSQNFIKRLVGLPGEALRIVHGDMFRLAISDTNGDGVLDENDLDGDVVNLDGWQIVRKEFETQNALWQHLFDSEYAAADRAQRLVSYKSPWVVFGNDQQAWDMSLEHGRSWSFDSSSSSSLRFGANQPGLFRPTNSYNTERYNRGVSSYCSDLKLETAASADTASGTLRLVLGNFDHRFAAECDIATGRVRLLHAKLTADNQLDWTEAAILGETQVDITGGKAVRLGLFHCDWRVGLCVNQEPVIVSTPQQYDVTPAWILKTLDAHGEQRPVVRIEAENTKLTLTRTTLMRDLYYTEPQLYGLSPGPGWNYARKVYGDKFSGTHASVSWASPYNPIVLRKYPAGREHLDEFFMCGDNSPASHDSRLWTAASPTLRLYNEDGSPQYRLGTVPRYNLVGKACFVFWPSGYPLGPKGNMRFAPNAGKMRRIH